MSATVKAPRVQTLARLLSAEYASTSRNGNPRWTLVIERPDGTVTAGVKTAVDSSVGYEMRNLENARSRAGGVLEVHVRGDSTTAVWDVHRTPADTGAAWPGCALCDAWKAGRE